MGRPPYNKDLICDHPKAKHLAKGMCRSCYRKKKWNKKGYNKAKATKKTWYETHRRWINRKTSLRRYKLSIKDYRELIKKQHGKCAICQKLLRRSKCGTKSHPNKTVAPSVDHNHRTGRIRGILCFKCNLALGLLEDKSLFLKRALKYILAK